LLGPWRASFDAALADAIRAKQARRDEEGDGWLWVVPGGIEERESADPVRSGDFQVASGQHRTSGDAD